MGIVTFGLMVMIAVLCTPAVASTITIGGTNTNNCYPFTCGDYTGDYQQVYSATAFSQPVFISAITFFTKEPVSGYGTAWISGNFTIHFSTTTAAVNGLSADYASNVGPDNALFFSGNVSHVLSFVGTPFLYDPSAGNLLMSVYTPGGNLGTGTLEAGNTSDTSRVFNLGGNGPSAADGIGLQTAFSVATVPEPTSLLLLVTGVGLIGLVAMRRGR
jgi:hypothetical protein